MREKTGVFVQHVPSTFLIRCLCVHAMCGGGVRVPGVRVSRLLCQASPVSDFHSASRTATLRLCCHHGNVDADCSSCLPQLSDDINDQTDLSH